MAPKVDPEVLRKEYITGDMSIRQLAATHDMSWSAIASRSRREDWAGKREAYRASVEQRAYDRTAARFASEEAEIRSEVVLAMRATVRAYINQLSNNEIKVSPKDAQGAAQVINLLMGGPTSRTESKVVEFSTGGLEPDVLRRLAELARARVVEGSVANGPAELTAGTGED